MVRSRFEAPLRGMGMGLVALALLARPASAQTDSGGPARADRAERPAPSVPAPSIAVVDAQLVFQKSLAVQSIQRQLDTQRAELTKSFGAQEENLRTAEQELARQRLALAPEAFEAKRKEFEQKVAEARRTLQDRTRKLDISFNEARDRVLRTINDVVAEVARERGVGLVVRRDVVLFQSDSTPDITDTVLQRVNTKLPQVTVSLPN